MAKRRRITLGETGGSQRAYSYLLPPKQKLPLGRFEEGGRTLPKSIDAELESLAQSDFSPEFFWAPDGGFVVIVEEIEL